MEQYAKSARSFLAQAVLSRANIIARGEFYHSIPFADSLFSGLLYPTIGLYFLLTCSQGHLAVSLLKHINKPLLNVPKCQPRPGFALLLTPWLELYPQPTDKAQKFPKVDTLDVPSLSYWASLFHDPPDDHTPQADREHLSVLDTSSNWRDILPVKTAITTGTDDFFKDACLRLYKSAQAEGIDIALKMEKGAPHDWQWLESSVELENYVATSRQEKKETGLKGAKELADIIISWAQSLG